MNPTPLFELLSSNLLISFLAVLALGLGSGFLLGRFLPPRPPFKPPELKGLFAEQKHDQSISRDCDPAIEELKTAALADSTAVESYFALGNLFRHKGEMKRAIRLHQSLLLRPSLSKAVQVEIYCALGIDYLMAGLQEKARAALQEAIRRDSNHLEAHRHLGQAYEEAGEWKAAFAVQKKLGRLERTHCANILAHLKTEEGRSLEEKGHQKGAKRCYKKALSLDKGCLNASLHLGDSYSARGSYRKAISLWKKALVVNQAFAGIMYLRLEEAYFQIDALNRMESLFREKIQRSPEDVSTRLYYGQFLYKKGDLERAVEQFKEALKIEPSFTDAQQELGKLLLEQGRKKELVEEYQKILDTPLPREKEYLCHYCGYQTKSPVWKCPRCLRWDTIYPETSHA